MKEGGKLGEITEESGERDSAEATYNLGFAFEEENSQGKGTNQLDINDKDAVSTRVRGVSNASKQYTVSKARKITWVATDEPKDGNEVQLAKKDSAVSTTPRRKKSSHWMVQPINESDRKMSVFVPAIQLTEKFVLDDLEERERKITLAESYPEDRSSSFLLALWNMMALLQGSAVFSMPYAVAVGGWVTLIFFPIISFLSDQTSLMIVQCLYEVSTRSQRVKRVRQTLGEVARQVWGVKGEQLITTTLFFYLFVNAVANILLIGKSMFSILEPHTDLSFTEVTIISSLLCYPVLFVTKITYLAYFSMTSVAAIVIGTISVLVVFIVENGQWETRAQQIYLFNLEKIPLALGIILYSTETQTIISQIEGSMKSNKSIGKALHTAFSASTLTKIMISVFGAITYGSATNGIIILNVASSNVIVGYVCSALASIYGLCTYPLYLFMICDTFDGFIEGTIIRERNVLFYPWVAISRLLVVAVTVVIALVMPYFGIITAIRGSLFGTCFMFLFPCYFHVRLKWDSLSAWQKCKDITILLVGTGLGGVALYSSVRALVLEIQK